MSTNDDHVLRLYRELFEHDEPIPSSALEAAYAAPSIGRLDEELAELVFDSQLAGTAMRGTETETRLMSFVNDHVTIDVELRADGRTVVGQITPVDGDELIVEVDGGDDVVTPLDDFGRFRAEVSAWPIRLRLTGRALTPWIGH